MKNIFLFGVCIVLLSIMKMADTKKVEVLERIEVKTGLYMKFKGTVFLPRSVKIDEKSALTKMELRIADKSYSYVRFNKWTLHLETGTAIEVPVVRGDRIVTNVPLTLFFSREVEQKKRNF